jgi:acyl-homoserine lactone acylase PvdQ
MQVANVNRPEGKGYGTAFNEWLRRYKVDDMDKSDRAKLLRLMEQRPAIEEWRGTLTTSERLNLNNPTLAWRRWTADTRVKNPRPRTAGVSAMEHGRAQAMVQQLQARTEELEQELVSARQSLDEVSLDDLLRATAAKLKPMSRSDQESALGRLRDMLPPEEEASELGHAWRPSADNLH